MRIDLLEIFSRILWGWPVLSLIVAAGLHFSLISGFFQLRCAARWMRAAVGGTVQQPQEGSTRFQAISTALAGSIGTGNIVGVAAAISVGGPGALFWMWISALLGMMTIYAENYLAAKHRKVTSGPGPLSYIEKVGRPLAAIYAAGCCLSSLGMGNMVQTNALSAACRGLGVPPLATAAAVGGLVFFVAKGGLARAMKVTEKLVPAMTLLFFAASLGVLWVFRSNLPKALEAIFSGAFQWKAGAGGTAGMLLAMKAGVSRGVFTNEAGLGSSAFAYQDLRGHSPGEAGCMGIFQVFADTIVMCTVTGLCILCAGTADRQGAEITFAAYQAALGKWGGWAVSACTALFALATVTAWCCYGREGLFYLVKGRLLRQSYAPAAALAAALGCLLPLGTVFQLGDAFNGLMALPNLAALFYFSLRGDASGGLRNFLKEVS